MVTVRPGLVRLSSTLPTFKRCLKNSLQFTPVILPTSTSDSLRADVVRHTNACIIINELLSQSTWWFYVGAGAIAPKPSLAPKCDVEHCLTNSKHRHIGAQ